MFIVILLAYTAVAENNKPIQSSSAVQSPNIYNCDNVEIQYSRDLNDYKTIRDLTSTYRQMGQSVQLLQRDVSDIRVQMARLACRISTRANNENSAGAFAAAKIFENEGVAGSAKVDSILKISYDLLLKEYVDNDKKQQELKLEIAEVAFERASTLNLRFKFDSAKIFYEKAVEYNPHNIDYQIDLANNYFNIGDIQAAFLALKNAEPIISKSDKKNKSRFYSCLTWVYHFVGKPDTAFFYLQSYAIDSSYTNNIDSMMAKNFSNIGFAWYLKGDYDKTIEYLYRSLSIDSLIFGENNPNISNRYSQLGEMWGIKGDYDKAIECFDRALAIDTIIYRKNYKNKHPDIADAYTGIALSWLNKADFDKAIQYFEIALSIDTSIFPKNHPCFSNVYSNLGYAWYSKGNNDKAIEFYSRALRIDTLVYNKRYPDIANCYNDLGLAWDSKGDYNKAISMFQHGIELKPFVFNSDSTVIKDLQKNLILTERKLRSNTQR
jgi:tetratricopeptide (TPR) repeat protein